MFIVFRDNKVNAGTVHGRSKINEFYRLSVASKQYFIKPFRL